MKKLTSGLVSGSVAIALATVPAHAQDLFTVDVNVSGNHCVYSAPNVGNDVISAHVAKRTQAGKEVLNTLANLLQVPVAAFDNDKATEAALIAKGVAPYEADKLADLIDDVFEDTHRGFDYAWGDGQAYIASVGDDDLRESIGEAHQELMEIQRDRTAAAGVQDAALRDALVRVIDVHDESTGPLTVARQKCVGGQGNQPTPPAQPAPPASPKPTTQVPTPPTQSPKPPTTQTPAPQPTTTAPKPTPQVPTPPTQSPKPPTESDFGSIKDFFKNLASWLIGTITKFIQKLFGFGS